jgi:signal transduction histidine kinase
VKPEIAAALFLPLVEQLKECDISTDRWLEPDPRGKPLALADRQWIDENAFREIIDALLEAGREERLVVAGRRMFADESLGMGDLLLPFADSPPDLLEPLAEQINLNARTLRVSLQRQEIRNTATLTLTAQTKRPGPPVLCRWLEALLTAAREVGAPFETMKQECMYGLVERKGGALKSDVDARACVYAVRWKQPRAKLFTSARRWRQEGVKLAKARKILTQQKHGLQEMQNMLRQQDALLQGIVSVSEATKTAKSYRELIQLTADRICADFGFDRSQIYLAREGQLEIVAVLDPIDVNWSQTIFAVCQANPIPLDGRTEESKAFAAGKPVVVNNPWNNIFVPQAQQEAWKSRGYVIVPIRGADRFIGLALADHYYKRRGIEPDDVDKLQALANISGMGIEKLRMIDRLEAKVGERTAELERANKKLTALYEKARESDRLKSDFLANMSHELRTPLNSVLGFSKLLLRGFDGTLNERQQTDVNAILNSGTHLLGLINDILDLSKIESGRMELKMDRFALHEVIEDVRTTGEVLLKGKPIEMLTELDPALLEVYGDRVRLRQVLLNLISNAIKFTARGQITITTKSGADEYYVAVADTGVGIPADKVEEAFERFRQLDSSPSRMQGGSGLGLTISKKFVEMHGGRIWVTSAEGVGSTFHIALPFKHADEGQVFSNEK